jgi:hypothetical protein
MTQNDDDIFGGVLDQFVVPEPRRGLIDDIVAAASIRAPQSWPSRTRSKLWARRGSVSLIAAFALMSATAGAAGGWFGERIIALPVISSIAAIIPDVVKATPRAKPKAEAEIKFAARPIPSPKQVAITPPITVPEPATTTSPTPIRDQIDVEAIKQEARAERLVDRVTQALNRRDARRAAFGLPVNSGPERAALAKLQSAQTPDERAEALTALKMLRAARRAAREERRSARATRGLEGDAEAKARAPFCTAEEAAQPLRNSCRPLRAEGAARRGRDCNTIPVGRWVPPRCRRHRDAVADDETTPTPQ